MPPREKDESALPVSGGADRISVLPDQVLHHLLSFLPAQEAVQTCVLASRWRHLWRCTTGLRIGESDREDLIHVKDLHKFVDHLLLLRECTDLDTVDIAFDEFSQEDQPYVNLWIRFAVMCKFNIDGHLYLDDLPLVSQHLKKLHLIGVALQKTLLDFASCPALEDRQMIKIVASVPIGYHPVP
uniref:F-box domain-containing protein n=1 Tax=Triticum urartu TaxID=4572 RepID=A0A8R7QZ28_TRIUA